MSKNYLFLIKTGDGEWQVATRDGKVLICDEYGGVNLDKMPKVEAGDIFLRAHPHEYFVIPKPVFND